MWHRIFNISFTWSKFSTWKTIMHLITGTNSQNMFIIYVIDLSTKNKMWRRGSYFYKNQEYRRLEKKYMFFSYFILEIPNFSYIFFFRKFLMFRRRIPLKNSNKMLLYTRREFQNFNLGGSSTRRGLICLIVLLEVFSIVFAKLQWFCCE